MEPIDNWIEDESCQTFVEVLVGCPLQSKVIGRAAQWLNLGAAGSMMPASHSTCLQSPVGMCVTYNMFTVFSLGGGIASGP